MGNPPSGVVDLARLTHHHTVSITERLSGAVDLRCACGTYARVPDREAAGRWLASLGLCFVEAAPAAAA